MRLFTPLSLAFIVLLIIAGITSSRAAYGEINVTINGRQINFAEQGPGIIDGRTLVPVREVFEQLNFTVEWHGGARQVFMQSDRYTVVLIIGRNTFYINGVPHFLEVPAQIIGDTTMVPLRAILEGVGYRINWHSRARTVQINTGISPRNFVFFYQRDDRWADVPFGSFTTARGACGPVALAMVVSTLQGENVYPCYVVPWASRFYVDGIGAAHSLFTSEVTHEHFGLTYRAIRITDDAEILEALRSGALLVTSVQAANSPNARYGAEGLFVIDPEAGGGHIAVIYGVTESGNVLVASPRHTALLYNMEGWPMATVRTEIHSGVGQFWAFTLE